MLDEGGDTPAVSRVCGEKEEGPPPLGACVWIQRGVADSCGEHLCQLGSIRSQCQTARSPQIAGEEGRERPVLPALDGNFSQRNGERRQERPRNVVPLACPGPERSAQKQPGKGRMLAGLDGFW